MVIKNDREMFELWQNIGLIEQSPENHVRRLIDDILIQSLYYPVADSVKTKVDNSRLKYYEIDANEPINWGDLSVSWVDLGENTIYIEEAAQDECPSLCEYIAKYLDAWGWGEFEIVTEW